MATRSKKIHFQEGRVRRLVEWVARAVTKDPYLAEDLKFLHATIGSAMPTYTNSGQCFNCGSVMPVKADMSEVDAWWTQY